LPSSSSPFSSFSECWVGNLRRPHRHSHCNLPNPTSPLKPPHAGAARNRACDLPVFQLMDWHLFTLSRAIPMPGLVDPEHHPDVIPAASVEYPPPSVVFTVNRRITARKSTAHRTGGCTNRTVYPPCPAVVHPRGRAPFQTLPSARGAFAQATLSLLQRTSSASMPMSHASSKSPVR